MQKKGTVGKKQKEKNVLVGRPVDPHWKTGDSHGHQEELGRNSKGRGLGWVFFSDWPRSFRSIQQRKMLPPSSHFAHCYPHGFSDDCVGGDLS